MTIRNRLTLLFLGLVAVILFAALSVTFLLHLQYTTQEFHQRLRDRAEVTGYVFLEQDELHESAFNNFRRRYLRTLNDEVLQIYDSSLNPRFIKEDARIHLSDSLLVHTIAEKELYFTVGAREAIGLFYHDNQGDFVIVAAAENRAGQARMEHLASMLGLVFVGSLLVIYIAGRLFAGRALAPIAAVNDQVDRITAHDLHLRVEEGLTSEKDEIARLARTFNRMLERLEESFEGQSTFVSNASHELRTPLTATIGELQVLLTRDREPAAYREALSSVLNELQQLKALINNLLEFTQATSGTMTGDEIRLDELLWEAREAVAPDQRRRVHITLGTLPPDPDQMEISGNRQLLGRALTNLFDNALKYSGDAPVGVHFDYAEGHAHILIEDHGIGIAEKDMAAIFQPFFRANNARGVTGHGVGLPLSRKIIELHGGKLFITSQLNQGTLATITF
ncbi:MAG TPA: ATP-binding protein [Hymenobacter sp.]